MSAKTFFKSFDKYEAQKKLDEWAVHPVSPSLVKSHASNRNKLEGTFHHLMFQIKKQKQKFLKQKQKQKFLVAEAVLVTDPVAAAAAAAAAVAVEAAVTGGRSRSSSSNPRSRSSCSWGRQWQRQKVLW